MKNTMLEYVAIVFMLIALGFMAVSVKTYNKKPIAAKPVARPIYLTTPCNTDTVYFCPTDTGYEICPDTQ